MSDATAITRQEVRGSVLLWFGLLAAPLAWLTQLVLNYSLEEWFACAPATTVGGEVLGMSVRTIAFGVTTVLATLAAAGGLAAASCLKKLRSAAGGDTSDRARWMAMAGVMNSILYFLITLASFGPPLLLRVCESTP